MSEAKVVYVLGFILNYRLGHGAQQAPPTSVLLIRKAKPKWQAGRLNGIGGKVEVGESPAEAMAREACEESAGVIVTEPGDWRHFATLSGAEVYNPTASAAFEIHIFSIFSDERLFSPAERATAESTEPLCEVAIEALFHDSELAALPNIRWMVAMALSFQQGESAERFVVIEEQAAVRTGRPGLPENT